MTDPRLLVVLDPGLQYYPEGGTIWLRAADWPRMAANIGSLLREIDESAVVDGAGAAPEVIADMVTSLIGHDRSVVLHVSALVWPQVRGLLPAGLTVGVQVESMGSSEGTLGWRGPAEEAEPSGGAYDRELLTETPPWEVDRRHVNVVVAEQGAAAPVTAPLAAGATYLARVCIGPLDADSVIADPPAFPHEHLPPTQSGWWLSILATGDALAFGDQLAQSYFLPRTGAGYRCGCEPGTEHFCRPAEQRPTVDIPVHAGTLRLAVYLEGGILVQGLVVDLPAGGLPTGRILWSLDVGVADLARHGRRTASVYEDTGADGRHRLIVGGGSGGQVPFELGEAQAASLARRLRTGLYEVQFDGKYSRFDDRNGKPRDAYLADLRALAVSGSEAYRTLLSDAATREELSRWLAEDAVRRRRPAVIQLARAANTRLAFPWQLVYDLPVIGDGSTAPPCPSAFVDSDDAPAVCPHAMDHLDGDGRLCPYGFWGLAHVLEVPPFTATGLVETTGERPPPTVQIGLNASLGGDAWDRHRQALDRVTGAPAKVATTVALLREALRSAPDVLYLLCHGTRVAGVPGGPPTVTLDFGAGGTLAPGDIDAWSRLDPAVRWTDRHPLVVLNGCFTGEVLPDTTAEFVAAFVGQSGAAGVLATEVTVEMRLAIEAMELFLTALWRGAGVGEALRAARWRLLRRGNLMGLAYSPYCDADLRIPTFERTFR